MNVLVTLVAILAVASADSVNDIRLARLFIGCCKKAMIGGVPSIPIPEHNPVVIRNFSYNGTFLNTSYNITLTKNILYNLVDFSFPKITAETYENPGRVAFNYDIYWQILNFTGRFEAKAPLVAQVLRGSYNVVMRDVHWTGLFNLTKPGQKNAAMNLDAFTLKSKTKSVSVKIDGINSVSATIIQATLKTGIQTLMNNIPASAAEFVRTRRFNGFWLSRPDRLHTLINHCKDSRLNF